MSLNPVIADVLPVLRRGARWGVRRADPDSRGGRSVYLRGEVARAGWYRTTGYGSQVKVRAPLSDDEAREVLAALPSRSGHHWNGRVVDDRGRIEILHHAPADEDIEVGARVVGRFWAPSVVLFDRVDMDDQPELSVREAVLQGQGIDAIPRVAASLRLAAALALFDRASQATEVPFAPVEVGPRLREVSSGGEEVARRILRELQVLRNAVRPADPLPVGRPVATEAVRPPVPQREPWVDRIVGSLARSGAVLVSARRAGAGRLEVIWSFRGGTYSSVLDDQNLNVLDAGICLAGTDRRFTLDSLPSVVREGEERERIVVTRHVPGASRLRDYDREDDYDD